MQIELTGTGPTDFDRVVVSGDVSLDGVLELLLDNSFNPDVGEMFEIIHTTGGTISGAFHTVLGATFGAKLLHNVTGYRNLRPRRLSDRWRVLIEASETWIHLDVNVCYTEHPRLTCNDIGVPR